MAPRRVSDDQLITLWNFLNTHRVIVMGHKKGARGAQTRDISQRLWTEVAKKLNSIIGGARKDWFTWQAYWIDYKNKLKKKCASILSSQSSTGWGPNKTFALTDIEKKYLLILGEDYGMDQLDTENSTSTSNAPQDVIPSKELVEKDIDVGPSPPMHSIQDPEDLVHQLSSTQPIQPAEPTQFRTQRSRSVPMSQEMARRASVETSHLQAGATQELKKHVSGSKTVLELDKFKRRLIRSVARLILHEKKPEEEIWSELKKENGCDCELIWTRMRALVVKKLNLLLAANDRTDAVPKAARMSLTDWLLFDLVLVHQQIDLIGMNNPTLNNKDLPALVMLVELVKKFKLEYLSGDNLAEAWSLATLYYNKQGHQCSPMLLQRRWYQLKETTRDKFYNFWYAYRGNRTRINFAEPHKPSPLQTEIARTFKLLIVQPFHEWEELIKQGRVTLPNAFERKMKERVGLMRPTRKPSEEVPDLVMIEPRIETIDLRLEPDDDAPKENKQEKEVPPPPPLVKIKQEPQDEMEVEQQTQPPKKSIYEVVLESTALENEQLDCMDAGDLNIEDDCNEIEEVVARDDEIEEVVARDDEIEEVVARDDEIEEVVARDDEIEEVVARDDEIEEDVARDDEIEGNVARDEEESMLPQISSVFGNVSDTSVLANIDDGRLNCNSYNTEASGNINDTRTVTNVCNDKNADEVGETILLDNENDVIACDGLEKSSGKNTAVDDSIDPSNDKDADYCDNIEGSGADERNEISDDEYLSGNVGETTVTENVIVTGLPSNDKVIGNVDETSIIDNVEDIKNAEKSILTNVIEDTKTGISNETDVLKAQTTELPELVNDVEIIDNIPPPVVITESDEDDDNVVDDLVTNNIKIILPNNIEDQPMEVDTSHKLLAVSLTAPLKISEDAAEKKVKIDIEKDFRFGELPNDISFADEGIEFVDDGIAYVDEDLKEIKTQSEEDDYDTPKIDSKLLMCPIIYTRRLDDMGLFHSKPFNYINDKYLLDAIIKKSKPIKIENDTKEKNKTLTVNASNEIKYENAAESNIGIIIKKESVNINSETIKDVPVDNSAPIKYPHENDGDVTSDGASCYDNEIDECQKVKPTSYLLQKPRSRRYTPIQLCKNPDFNTRLKRLSVGFFSSPRNRVLIKTCKPLTIDLSKAFESKMISGTLYLKPADHNVVSEIIDDNESQNVSVLPSAMPAQSLIDNSKVADILPMLRECCEASKQPENLSPTNERNKVINLPDISEIRRINQRLLTAEVTPIQIRNNRPQVPVSIVTSHSSTPTCAALRTIGDSENDLRLTVTEAADRRGPPKLLDITDDSSAKNSSECNTWTKRNNCHGTIAQKASGRQSVNVKRVFPYKPVAWKPRQFRHEIPWLSKNTEATNNARKTEDTLLTLDALNKMLFLLSDKKEPEVLAKKQKQKTKHKKSAHQAKQPHEPQKANDDDPSYILVPSKADETSEEQNKKCQKPKITIKSATNYPPDKNKMGDAGSEQTKKKVQYCCWARQRMLQLLFCRDMIPKHECPEICECCCRNLLKDYVLHEQKIKNAEFQIIKNIGNKSSDKNIIDKVPVVSEGTVSSETVEADDQNSVQSSVDTPGETPAKIPAQIPHVGIVQVTSAKQVLVPEDTPVIDIEAINTESTTNTSADNEPIDVDAIDTKDDVSSQDTVVVVAPPAPKKAVAPIKVIAKRNIVAMPVVKYPNFIPEAGGQAPIQQVTRCISSDNQSGGIILSVAPNTTISPPSLRNILAVKKAKSSNSSITNVPTSQRLTRPFKPTKTIKEKMIFLNSKQISEKPTANPVYLGKNKILLTTIKFPPNLKLFQDAKKALRASLNLPRGVHLILLSNGTISYKIDHDVEVEAVDMVKMPAIIAAVQAQTDLITAQEKKEALKKQNVLTASTIAESEVVDLVEDDDESDNVNVTSVSEGQTSEKSVTISSNDSLDVSHNVQKDMPNDVEENCTVLNIDSNVPETETESNRKESADQNTVTDTQKNIQNEMHSEQTEQEQVQPVQEVSAEQVLDNSESSDQNVNIEVKNNPDPPTQPVTTNIPEKSTDEPSRNKTKNILSDLMEMSGIFEEDMTSSIEESVPAQPVVPPLAPVSVTAGTNLPHSFFVPASLNNTTHLPPKLQSPLGELTPITSLYELKYACANKGVFFKLDFDTGFLVPINVCMKPTVRKHKPVQPPSSIPRTIAPKSVIDLTEDEDKQEQMAEQEQNKRSLLLVNNITTGPVKPVKLFKSLKPSILRQLNKNKHDVKMKNSFVTNSADHKNKRTQFLRKINMNAEVVVTSDSPYPVSRFIKNIKIRQDLKKTQLVTNEMDNEPIPTTSRTEPNSEIATTVLSDVDDSSDDEPLSKKAKRKHENLTAPASVTKNIELELPAEAPVEKQIESDLPTADVVNDLAHPEAPAHSEHSSMDVDGTDNEEPKEPVENITETELPADDTEAVYMSDDNNDEIDPEAPFGFDLNDSNEENEDCCILGV